jgi:hypothetical protein
VVHEDDGTHHRHIVSSKGDGVDLKDLAEAAEHAGDAGGVDVFGLEAGGRDQRAHARVTRDAAEGLLGEEVDTTLFMGEGLQVDGQVALRPGGEAEVHGVDGGADDLEWEVGGDVR